MNEIILEHFKRQAKLMSEEFEEHSKLGKGTPQEIADQREGYFRNFLERILPKSFIVTKGQVIDTFGNKSSSIDCLVLNPIHPNLVDSNGKFNFIMVEGVDFAYEIKSNVFSKEEIYRGLKQITSVKKLRRIKAPILLENRKSAQYIDYGRQIFTIIFFETGLPVNDVQVRNIYHNIKSFYQENPVTVNDEFDMIVINNTGIFMNYKITSEEAKPIITSNNKKAKVIFWKFGSESLMAMLAFSSKYHIPSEPNNTSAPKMLTFYFDQFLKGNTGYKGIVVDEID